VRAVEVVKTAKQEGEQQQIKISAVVQLKTWLVGSYISWMVFR